jgi:hypothetical protein
MKSEEWKKMTNEKPKLRLLLPGSLVSAIDNVTHLHLDTWNLGWRGEMLIPYNAESCHSARCLFHQYTTPWSSRLFSAWVFVRCDAIVWTVEKGWEWSKDGTTETDTWMMLLTGTTSALSSISIRPERTVDGRKARPKFSGFDRSKSIDQSLTILVARRPPPHRRAHTHKQENGRTCRTTTDGNVEKNYRVRIRICHCQMSTDNRRYAQHNESASMCASPPGQKTSPSEINVPASLAWDEGFR